MSDPLEFWYPWKPALFRQDTLDLSLEQEAIYRRLIDWYMENARPLPESINGLARIACVPVDAMSNAWSMLQAYFEHAPGIGWRNKRCDVELENMLLQAEKRVGKAKAAAKARWQKVSKNKKKKNADATSNAPSMPVAMLGDATNTNTNTGSNTTVDKSTSALPPAVPQVGFLDFWMLYPRQRRGSKEAAEKAWAKAITRATPDEILRGTTDYAQSDEVARGFAKGAAAWLNDDRWTSDYSTRAVAGNRKESAHDGLARAWAEVAARDFGSAGD